MTGRGAHLRPTPWARDALYLDPDAGVELSRRAVELGCYLGLVAKQPGGPYVVDVTAGERRLRVRGWDLVATAREALERFAAGADDRDLVHRAGADGIEHLQIGRRPTWALCKRPAIGEQFAYPATTSCIACLRALDTRIAA